MSTINLSGGLNNGDLRISTRGSFKLKRRPGRKTLVMAPESAEDHLDTFTQDKSIQIALFQGLARAYYWQRLLDDSEVSSGSEIAKLEGLNSSTVNELLRLTLLDPSLVLDILDGKPPQAVSMVWFTRNALPDLWHEQFMSSHTSQERSRLPRTTYSTSRLRNSQ